MFLKACSNMGWVIRNHHTRAIDVIHAGIGTPRRYGELSVNPPTLAVMGVPPPRHQQITDAGPEASYTSAAFSTSGGKVMPSLVAAC